MKISHLIIFLLGWIISVSVYLYWDDESEPELTCEVVEMKIWATQQCLKFQPACKMNKGPETFTEYKRNKDWVQANCPDSGDDFLSH